MPMVLSLVISLYLADIYGAEIGYQLYNIGGPAGKYVYGGPTVFMAALLVVGVLMDRIIWPAIVETGQRLTGSASRRMLSLTRKVHARPRLASGEIREAVERGYLLNYHGLISRRLQYTWENKSRYGWLHCSIDMQRNTLAMPPRERLFVRVLLELENYGLPPDTLDGLHFAMTWGDGRCRVSGGKYKAKAGLLAQYGIRDHRSMVTMEAGFRDATVEGAITEMATLLQQAARDPRAPDEIKTLCEELLYLRDAT